MSKKLSFNYINKVYTENKKSVPEIARTLNCSENRINYWLKKYDIKKRTISEAIYNKNNPKGDPFKYKEPDNLDEAKLLGLGLGLYWGEGTKKSKNSVKLGNTDVFLLRDFIKFLEVIFSVKKSRLKFQVQIFTDINEEEAVKYWMEELKIKKEQFYKTVITKSGSLGTYREKSKYGVLTIYFHNTKLRNILVNMLPG